MCEPPCLLRTSWTRLGPAGSWPGTRLCLALFEEDVLDGSDRYLAPPIKSGRSVCGISNTCLIVNCAVNHRQMQRYSERRLRTGEKSRSKMRVSRHGALMRPRLSAIPRPLRCEIQSRDADYFGLPRSTRRKAEHDSERQGER